MIALSEVEIRLAGNIRVFAGHRFYTDLGP